MKHLFFAVFFCLCVFSLEAQNCYWANGVGGPHEENGQAIATDASGNQYVTGTFSSATVTFGSFTLTNANNNTYDFYLVKYNSAHNVVWAKRAGGTIDELGYGVTTDAAGNVYVTGTFFGDSIKFSPTVFLLNNNLGNADFFLVKYDSGGNPQWARRASGGSSDDIGRSVSLDATGNIFVTGYFYSPTLVFGSTTLTNSGSGIDLFFAKFDSSGNPLWAKSAGGAGNYDYGRAIDADINGDVWITGSFSAPTITFGATTLTNQSGDDIFVAKYSTTGTALWAKSIGKTDNEAGFGIVTDANGDGYVTGGFQSDTISFGSYTVTNSTNHYGFFLTKYNTSGNALWVRTSCGPYDNIGYALTTDAGGNILVTGKFQSGTIIFGSDTLHNPSSIGGADLFIAKYNNAGNALWSGNSTGIASTQGWGIAADNNSNIYVTGTYMGSPVFGPTTLTNGGGFDVFVADVYPFTPSISSATSVSCFGGNDGAATVTNAGGNSPFTYTWSNAQTTSTITGVTAGNYTVTVTDANSCAHMAIATITQPLPLTLSMNPTDPDCANGIYGSVNVSVAGGTPSYSYLWNNAMTTSTISNLAAGNYSVTVTDANGCTAANSVSLNATPAPVSPICMVTVDQASQYNVIVWDKTGLTDVDSFIVYREINANDYRRIAAVPYDSLSQFIDTVRTLYFPNTGDPNAGTYRYKLQARDSCGNYAMLSNYHNTIFISNNNGVFSWAALYTIESSPNPVLNYVLLRDNLSNGNWLPVSSVAGTQQTISDPNYATYAATGSWRVETFWNISCTPTYRGSSAQQMQSLNNSFSNTTGNAVTTGILQNENSPASVFPNPNNGVFEITVKNVLPGTRVEIFNAYGSLVESQEISSVKTMLDLGNNANGIYFYTISSASGISAKGKLMKE